MTQLKLILIFFILTNTLSPCLDLSSPPHTTLIKSVPNQDSSNKAVLLQNDGDATVDASLQVSVLDFNTKLIGSELGNTFIVDRNHGATSLDSTSINFTWLSKNNLQVDYDQKLRVFTQAKKVNDVTIIYKPR